MATTNWITALNNQFSPFNYTNATSTESVFDFSLATGVENATDWSSGNISATSGAPGGGGGDQWSSSVFGLVNASVVDFVDTVLNESLLYDTGGGAIGAGVIGPDDSSSGNGRVVSVGTGSRVLVNGSWTRLFNGTHSDVTTSPSRDGGLGFVNGLELDAAVQGATWPGDSMYPSGHSLPHIVATAVFVTIIMITVVVGNMLVIVAIVTEKALKTIQNWFIASLAVADFFLGLVVMPFSLAQELMGYWIFGSWWCEIHLAVDVLLCTSSIMNLCLISLDRYWSITQAVDYLKKRTPTRAAIMITSVWILSFLVSVPPLLGWKSFKPPPQDLPFCEVSDDTGYVIYSASGSFYIPSVIMVFVYVRIYFAARSRARRVVRKPRPTLDPTKDKSTTTTSFSNTSPPDKTKTGMACTTSVEVTMALTAPDGPVPLRLPLPSLSLSISPTLSPAPSSSSSFFFSRRSTNKEKNKNKEKDKKSKEKEESGKKAVNGNTSQVPIPGPQQVSSAPTTPAAACASSGGQTLPAEDTECASEMDHSSDSERTVGDGTGGSSGNGRRRGGVDGGGATGGLRRLHHLCNPPARKTSKARRDEIDLGRIQKPRDPEREKRRIARKKERRATLILGLIMTAFILSWLPFFTMYVVRGLCISCRDWMSGLGFGFAFWLGYCNSALNPVIYTIFSKDFRRAFRKILFK